LISVIGVGEFIYEPHPHFIEDILLKSKKADQSKRGGIS